MMQSSLVSKLGLSAATLILMMSTDSWARPTRSREECGITKKVDKVASALTILRERGGEPLEVVFNSDTTFLSNSKPTNSASIKEGLRTCIYYRSPFFGRPFATKVILATSSAAKAD